MQIHIEGMGVIGSILARRLYARGVQFTWNDRDDVVCAWKASTGCVYPAGDPAELEAYCRWREWHDSEGEDANGLSVFGVTESAAYWFLTKNPPHGGKYPIEAQIGNLRMGARPTIQVNVQELVAWTRRMFRFCQTEALPDSHFSRATRVVSHGFGARCTHYKWGWSARARLQIAPEFLEKSKPFGRPNFYLKRGATSFLIYAYPVPGEPDRWYAGSTVIRQTKAKPLGTEKKVRFWRDCVEKSTDGAVKVLEVGEATQGWRPCGADGDTEYVKRVGNDLLVRPMSHSGVRMAPLVTDAILKELGL